MSLIHTCQLWHVNSFDYLTELLRHIRTWLPSRRYGCPGITASNCHRLTYDDLVWPKRIEVGHGWVTL
jgi:hypothetical protein